MNNDDLMCLSATTRIMSVLALCIKKFSTMIFYSLKSATAKFEEGIKTCIFVLSQLGIAVPTEINLDIYSTEVCQVKQLMSGKTENDLLSLPLLVEKQKLVRDLH